MSSLLVVTGPPGSGKSTFAKLMATRSTRSVLVEGDAFFGFLAEGQIPPWLPESSDQNRAVVEASGLATGRFVADGYDTTFDGIIGPWFLPAFQSASGVTELDWVVLLPSEVICRTRVKERARASFKDLAATSKMHREFTAAAIDPRHVVDSGGVSPEMLVDIVETRRSDGALRVSA